MNSSRPVSNATMPASTPDRGRLEAIIHLQAVSREQALKLLEETYVCPVCRQRTVRDTLIDWVLEPVNRTYICLHCSCEAAAYVLSPGPAASLTCQFTKVAEEAGLTNREARLIWLKHLQNSIMVAMRSGRAEKSADDDLLLIAELIARAKAQAP